MVIKVKRIFPCPYTWIRNIENQNRGPLFDKPFGLPREVAQYQLENGNGGPYATAEIDIWVGADQNSSFQPFDNLKIKQRVKLCWGGQTALSCYKTPGCEYSTLCGVQARMLHQNKNISYIQSCLIFTELL